MVLLQFLMTCDHLGLQFREGKSARALESTSNAQDPSQIEQILFVASLGGWRRRCSRPNGSYGSFTMSRVCRSGFNDVSMACGRLLLRFRPGEPVGEARKYSHHWQITRNYQKWTNIVVWSFAPTETLLGPPRWLAWTKWYDRSVPK